MNSLTFNFVVSWFIVKPEFVCLNVQLSCKLHQKQVQLDSTSILCAQITLNNQFDYVFEYDWWDYILFFYKVLLGLCYSTSPQASCQIYMCMCNIMSIISQLHDQVWLQVCCLTLDIDIPVIALLICLYKHRQTITLHAFSMFIYWKEKETHILNFLTSDLYWEHYFS